MMNIIDFVKLTNDRHKTRMVVYEKKAHDYATGDMLSNFKRIGQVIEILRINQLPGRLCYCFTMILLKLDRWVNLALSGVPPANESVDDTIMDLENYVGLAAAIYFEKDSGKESGEKNDSR